MCSIERSDVYLVNENSTLESVNRVYEIGEKSHSLLDHPRMYQICVSMYILSQFFKIGYKMAVIFLIKHK